MPTLMLSYFDSVVGPIPFKFYPEEAFFGNQAEILKNIASHLDTHKENEVFEVYYGEQNLAVLNYVFSISSEWARGMRELLMCSVLDVGREHLYDTYRPYLLLFKDFFELIPDVFKGLYQNSFAKVQMFPEIRDIRQNIDNFVEKFQMALPNLHYSHHPPTVSIFGLSNSGKVTIVKQLEDFHEHTMNNSIEILNPRKYALNSIKYLLYESIAEISYKEHLMKLYCSADISIFVINHSDNDTLAEAKKALSEIVKYMRERPIPLAIVIIKHEEDEINIEEEYADLQQSSNGTLITPTMIVLTEKTMEGIEILANWIFANLP